MPELALVLRVAVAGLLLLSGGLELPRFADLRTVVEGFRVHCTFVAGARRLGQSWTR
jgi:hypothetical protein